MTKFGGVYPPIATPFGPDGELDQVALASNIQRWNQTGLTGYVVAGSNGESATLTDQEVAQATAVVRQQALPGMKVIAGTGREATAQTIRLTQQAADAGADAALVVTPFFYSGQMTHAALVKYYAAVADASPIPVLVYNVPKFTNLNIGVKTVATLAEHANIAGLKDSSGNIGQMIDFVAACPADFEIFCGNGPAYLSALQMGAAGGILALANVAPRECVEIKRLHELGDAEAARALHLRLIATGKAVTSGYGVPGLKACLDLLGYAGGDPRPPTLPADQATRAACQSILTDAGLLT